VNHSRPSPAVTELLTYLADLGYDELHLRRPASTPAPVASEEATPAASPPGGLRAAEALARQAAAAATCTACRLAEGRRKVVFGMGAPNADLMWAPRRIARGCPSSAPPASC
jgi:hypothetical protein